jgi:hypothetical protein
MRLASSRLTQTERTATARCKSHLPLFPRPWLARASSFIIATASVGFFIISTPQPQISFPRSRGVLGGPARPLGDVTVAFYHCAATIRTREMVLSPDILLVHNHAVAVAAETYFGLGKGPRRAGWQCGTACTSGMNTQVGIIRMCKALCPLGACQEQVIGAVGYSTPDLPARCFFLFRHVSPSS